MFTSEQTVGRAGLARALTIVLFALSGALGLPAPSAGAANAVYGGTLTRSGDALVLKANAAGTTLKSAVLAWSAPCVSGNTYGFARAVKVFPASAGVLHPGAFETSRNGRGSFRARFFYTRRTSTGSALESMTLTGRFKPGSASGTLKADVMFTDAPPLSATPPDHVTVLDTDRKSVV